MYSIFPRSRGPVLGIQISGKIDIDQERALTEKAEELIAAHGKVSFLVVLGDDVSASMEAAWSDLKWVMTHMSSMNKIAIVSDSRVLAALTAMDSPFAKLAGIQEKHFDRSEIETAWHWIES